MLQVGKARQSLPNFSHTGIGSELEWESLDFKFSSLSQEVNAPTQLGCGVNCIAFLSHLIPSLLASIPTPNTPTPTLTPILKCQHLLPPFSSRLPLPCSSRRAHAHRQWMEGHICFAFIVK